MATEQELLPCAHCGSHAHVRETKEHGALPIWWVECVICEIGTKYHDSAQGAAATWNARALPTTEQGAPQPHAVLEDDIWQLLLKAAAGDCVRIAADMKADCIEQLPIAEWCVTCQARDLVHRYSALPAPRVVETADAKESK